MFRSSVLALLAVAVAQAEVTVLTEKNFDTTVFETGKSVFVKFFAPWCGHCKAMKPAWDEVAGEYKDSPTVVIADVDCTVEQSLCQKYGVKGYPTVKYFQEDDGSDYKGGRDVKALKEFVESELSKPICNSANKAACSAEDLVEIEKWEKVTAEERKAEIERIEKEVKELEKAHDDLLETLQKQYEESKEMTETKTNELSKPLKFLKKIKDADKKDEL